jgi:glutathione peroxidase-family protein
MGKKFKQLRSVGKSYEEQGYIYFCCRNYRRQPQKVRARIDELCEQAGGEHAEALKAVLCSAVSSVAVCDKYHLSEATLNRVRNRFYSLW